MAPSVITMLVNILPSLALISLALTGLEDIPVCRLHSSNTQYQRPALDVREPCRSLTILSVLVRPCPPERSLPTGPPPPPRNPSETV